MIALVYMLLTLVGLAGAAFTFFRAERRADIAILFAVAAALVMLADWIAFGWFGLYSYHPHLLADKLADSALGEFLADILFVPSLGVVLVCQAPGLSGILLGTAMVTGLELLFLQMGIFHQHGWPLWGTTAGFLFYFAALDLFWSDLRHKALSPSTLRRVVRACLLFDMIALLTLALRATRAVETDLYLMPTYMGNQALGRFITYVIIAMPPAYWALAGKGAWRWVRIAAVTVAMAIFDWAMTTFGIQRFASPWNGLWDALGQGAAYALAALLEDLLCPKDPERR